ncbi:MAG: hypothetical protein JWN48_1054 [Myxococcaceae bacterium]|nr:hypothetical protein [Myxococcaceae bacterium]
MFVCGSLGRDSPAAAVPSRSKAATAVTAREGSFAPAPRPGPSFLRQRGAVAAHARSFSRSQSVHVTAADRGRRHERCCAGERASRQRGARAARVCLCGRVRAASWSDRRACPVARCPARCALVRVPRPRARDERRPGRPGRSLRPGPGLRLHGDGHGDGPIIASRAGDSHGEVRHLARPRQSAASRRSLTGRRLAASSRLRQSTASRCSLTGSIPPGRDLP